MDTISASKRLESLASPTRLDILRLLLRMGSEGTVAGDIATTLGIAPNKLSFHLKTLSLNGLISARAEGRFHRYCANLAAMQELLDYLGEEYRVGSRVRQGNPGTGGGRFPSDWLFSMIPGTPGG